LVDLTGGLAVVLTGGLAVVLTGGLAVVLTGSVRGQITNIGTNCKGGILKSSNGNF